MRRITNKDLETLCNHLNEMTDSPLEPWTRDENGTKANIGNFHISHAYGGVCLHRMCNSGGGVTTPILSYHCPKRELYEKMHAFMRGLEFKKEA